MSIGKSRNDRELEDRSPSIEVRAIKADDLAAHLEGDGEIAVLDVRELGAIATSGTLLLAAPVPFAALEDRIDEFVPRFGTPIVLIDSTGGRLARDAYMLLTELGYLDVAVLVGGTDEWRALGRQLYTSVMAFGQAFGEFLHDHADTPRITAAEYADLVAAGADVLLLDSRPDAEFNDHSIPGALCAPGAELVHRGIDLIQSDETIVVVNCAGRTRGILGAQAFVDAGVLNKVVTLENGTMAWSFTGRDVVHGRSSSAPTPSDRTRHTRTVAAASLIDRFGLKRSNEVPDSNDVDRTDYIFDVRTYEEFAAGHVAGSRWAPSWDLVPFVFRYAATLRARITLVDDAAGLRAALTGAWFTRLGWKDVTVISVEAVEAVEASTSIGPAVEHGEVDRSGSTITAQQLRDSAEGVVVIDLAASDEYSAAHVPGAVFATWTTVLTEPELLPDSQTLVLTTPDGRAARFVAARLRESLGREVVELEGGTAGWLEQVGTSEAGLRRVVGPVDDRAPGPWEAGVDHAAFRDYLHWERELVGQMELDSTTPYSA
ncbi:hypothetical protein CH267_13205 [Rhodococcus sp. 06-621-2]|nr:rhodanese-like domain-containing protein [Rhodococcus sp. 06-621-2]OZC55526.1 hypothetical protein CH267_13205 [Rhodococcus sp. 06-621-2]